MADEITAGLYLKFAKSAKLRLRNNGTFQDDVTGTDYTEKTQVLSTSEEALVLGDVGTPGWCWMRNNSSTAAEIISVRQATGAANMISIPAGCEVVFKFASNTTAPYVISASGTPELEYLLIEA